MDCTGIIELQPSWSWECPHCGRMHHEPGQTYKPTMEDVLNQPEAFDSDMIGKGEFISMPERVHCLGCKAVYAVNAGQDEE